MLKIYNNIIPFKGFICMNLFGVLFIRKEYKGVENDTVTLNHEAIHTRQCIEMLGVIFYLWYAIEWLIRLLQYGKGNEAYRNISFEREAYANERKLNYPKERERYGWWYYLKHKI